MTILFGFNRLLLKILLRSENNTLAGRWYGRTFIHTYYAVSPALDKWFGHTKRFKKMWSGKLDRMVDNFKKSGVEEKHGNKDK